jgi:Na+/proline symporter
MSTLSSSLNSSASALVHDFGWFSADASAAEESPERSVELTRRFSVMIGLVQIGVGFGATLLTDTVVSNALTIAGFSAGLLLGVYALGVLTRDVSETAALCGAGCGLCGLVLLQFGGPLVTALQPVWPGWTYAPVAWPWLALIGATTTFATGRLLTLLMPQLRETPR